jgi:hypothetical protein
VLTESPYSVGGVNIALPMMAGHDDRDQGVHLSRPPVRAVTSAADGNPYRPDTPAPFAEDWRRDAACARVDPELWFPECVPGYREDVAAALAICGTCPVQSVCLATAVQRNEHGIWGGMTEKQRRALTPAKRRQIVAEHADTLDGRTTT